MSTQKGMEIYYKNNNNSKLLKNRAETLDKWLEEYFNSEGCMCAINNVSVCLGIS